MASEKQYEIKESELKEGDVFSLQGWGTFLIKKIDETGRRISWIPLPPAPRDKEGKVVIADRYTASNIGHQGGKIENKKERSVYFKWLFNLE